MADESFRWRLWCRSFDYRLMPALGALDVYRARMHQLGESLWTRDFRQAFEADYPRLFEAAPDAEHRELGASLRAVAVTWYALGRAFCAAHDPDPTAAHTSGLTAMWFGVGAAVMDHVLDELHASPRPFALRLSRAALAAAFPEDPDVAPAAPPELPPLPLEYQFAHRCIDLGLAGLRARYRAAPAGPWRTRTRFEILACLEHMAQAELASGKLRLDGGRAPTDVEGELRTINTMMVWLTAYVGLLGGAPPEPVLAALRRVADRVGDVGWLVDALADTALDLRAGVWSLVWSQQVAVTGADKDKILADPDRALAELEAGPVLDHLLARLESNLLEIDAEPDLPDDARRELGALCRVVVWSGLSLPEPPAPAP